MSSPIHYYDLRNLKVYMSFICVPSFLLHYNTHMKSFCIVRKGSMVESEKVLFVTFSVSEIRVKVLQTGKKIVAKMFGEYVIKHYFCTRIRARVAVIDMM